MKTYSRKQCILCINSLLLSFSKLDFPVYSCVPFGTINDSWEIEYGYCENCYSVQIMMLADPEVLYDKNYFQPLNYTYLWIQHNIAFTKFIIDNLDTDTNNKITEVGSSSFCLGKHLIHYYKDYTVFDYSLEQATRRDDIKYIEGNCETYNFSPDTNIVMSHVFEHLYDPKKFISNCLKNCVKNIFISIPSMDDKSQFHITDQHTFLYNINDIEYIFGLYNYKMNDSIIYNTKDQQSVHIDNTRHLFSVNLLLKKIIIPKNTFISVCGMWSIITYSMIENKENIIGVIDMDKLKQNKKFGTTEIMVYPYEHLLLCADVNIIVNHPKKINIINMLKKYNHKINIILIE